MVENPVLPYIWMLCGSLSFALMGAMAHALASYYDWQVIALMRSFLALVLAAALARLAGAKLVFWRPRTLWLRSIAGSISLVCTFFAFTRLPVSEVLSLSNTFPIWVAVLSWPILGEPPSFAVWLSVASGVLGVVLIQQPHFAEGNFASVIALAGSFTTAIAMMGLHRLHQIDPRAIVAHFSGTSVLFCITSLFVFGRASDLLPSVGSGPLLMLFGVGVAATIGQLFLTRAFAAGSPAKVSVVALTQIVFAMGIDVLVWQRSFNPATLLGISLVVGPTAWMMAHRV
jgi:drug/metabolite transporter (DMT)-like permease